jgi:hypothetical protein
MVFACSLRAGWEYGAKQCRCVETEARASLTRGLAEDVPSAQKVEGIQPLHCGTTFP